MTIFVSIHNIKKAVGRTHAQLDFDSVDVFAKDDTRFQMYLPHGTGPAVADAINAAVKPKETE